MQAYTQHMTTSDAFLSPPGTGTAPPFLTNSREERRPSSPIGYSSNAYNTLPTPPLSSTNPFQFDPAASTSSGSSRSSSFQQQQTNQSMVNNNNNNPYFDSLAPPTTSVPPNMMTRAASSSSGSIHQQHPGASGVNPVSSQQQAPPIISYDPNGSPSDFDEDDDEGEAATGGRPRKRKSTRDLRAAASNQASAQASSSKGASNGAPSGDDDKDDDKGRRKIQIEYIEEKSKRHITFSKRKAGIMKKVRSPLSRPPLA